MHKFAAVVAPALLATAAPAGAVVLYDGSAGTTPQSQGYLYYLPASGATETVAAGVTTLNTSSDNSVRTGFSNDTPFGTAVNAAFPTLSPTTGFDLSFTAKVDAESHASTDRAGFSVILLGSDRRGVELSFWTDQVFAQADSPIFTHAETSSGFSPGGGFHAYDLAVLGSTYTLSADGVRVLTGSTRDYTAYGSVPYTLANYLFVGDDTTSASATVELSRAAVSVPEPTAVAALAAAGVGVAARRRRSAAGGR